MLFTFVLGRRMQVRHELRVQAPYIEVPEQSTIRQRPDVGLWLTGSQDLPRTRTGEAYTIKRPRREVRLTYHQDLPRHLIDIDAGFSDAPSASEPRT
jgi:hypothetical protein